MKASPAVSLLLTNLQLLDYYSSTEAFPISVETFTSLKNKGKAFEHIVHHLFHVYQPAEAAARFQACWPIYEPIQSKELRNVAFKWLTDLKRNGHLQTGGNVIIRRSLLDDCSGERYEELLLALSTMVLRNQVEREVFNDKKRQTIAYKQCTTHTPSLGLLTPLTLAHQSSLTRLLASRNASKAQWTTFTSLLKQKEEDLQQISSQLSPVTVAAINSEVGETEVISKWTNNWLGDDRWLDVLLHGDTEFHRDKLLEAGFEKAMARHQALIDEEGSGKVSGSAVSLAGLKALEKQVEEQKKRVLELRRMREGAIKSLGEVRDEHQGDSESIAVEGDVDPPQTGLNIVFKQHLELQVSPDTLATSNVQESHNNDEYSIFLEDLRAELNTLDSTKRRRRPRPVLTPFRPQIPQNGMTLEYKTEGQGPLFRKTLLPQPATKLPKPGSNLLAQSKPPTLPRDIGAISQVLSHDLSQPEHILAPPATIYSNIQENSQIPQSPQRSLGFSEGVKASSSNKRSAGTNPALSSPSLILPPNTRQRITPEASSKYHEMHDRSISMSTTLSDELFSDVEESVLKSSIQSKNESPERSRVSGPCQSTPQSKHQLYSDDYDDNELTPKPLIFKNPSKRNKFSGFPTFENPESLAEQIVSEITNSNYSPERPSPMRRPSASPTRTNRFGFGLRSPEVSPIKPQSPGFNVFDHSTLLSLASSGSSSLSSSPLPSNIPIHPSSPDYKPQSLGNSRLRFQRSGTFSSPDRGIIHNGNSEQLHLSLDTTSSNPVGPIIADTTPREELLSSEDYNSVFKSRPKVALSPVFTPISQPGSTTKQGVRRGRISPDFMSLNTAASASESEDGGDREGGNPMIGSFGGGSRIPGFRRN